MLILLVAFPLSYVLSPDFALFSVIYFVLNLAYTLWV
jgi:hypothetical protein